MKRECVLHVVAYRPKVSLRERHCGRCTYYLRGSWKRGKMPLNEHLRKSKTLSQRLIIVSRGKKALPGPWNRPTVPSCYVSRVSYENTIFCNFPQRRSVRWLGGHATEKLSFKETAFPRAFSPLERSSAWLTIAGSPLQLIVCAIVSSRTQHRH